MFLIYKSKVCLFVLLCCTEELTSGSPVINQTLGLPSKLVYSVCSEWCNVICCVDQGGAVPGVGLYVVCHVNDGCLHTPQGETRAEAAHDKRWDKRGDWEPIIQHVWSGPWQPCRCRQSPETQLHTGPSQGWLVELHIKLSRISAGRPI